MSKSIPDDNLPNDNINNAQFDEVMHRADKAMRLVCANLPWLSGLAYAVKIFSDDRVSVAAVTRSGRVMINPQVFLSISISEAVFILAHELLHLALDTFRRKSDFVCPKTVNQAHDYIINDILRQELQMSPPLGGLDWEGASKRSLEQIVIWIIRHKSNVPLACWTWSPKGKPGSSSDSLEGQLSRALREAGLSPNLEKISLQPESKHSWHLENLDVIPDDLERELFPENEKATQVRGEIVQKEAVKALALCELHKALDDPNLRKNMPGNSESTLNALRRNYVTPWEVALQRWLEALAPGARTYSRPSRRGANRTDCVLPGRLKEGWTLHLVLDTSGSMAGELPKILGSIAIFCENAGVTDLHIVQCDSKVTVDEWIPIEQIAAYQISGFGGSDMSPAMQKLSDDPEVTAFIVFTDGFISYPDRQPPCQVLWVLTIKSGFRPHYGEVIMLR